jgi:hypothetical protein
MRTATINVFKIQELEPKAKEKAFDILREGIDSSDFQFLNERLLETFAVFGFDTRKEDLEWSRLHCQGGGLRFKGGWKAKDFKAEKFEEIQLNDEALRNIGVNLKEIVAKFPESYAYLKHIGHMYTHEYTVSVEFFKDERESEDDFNEDSDAEKRLLRAARELMQWGFKQVADYDNHLNSEANLLEMAQDLEFTADGKIFHDFT